METKVSRHLFIHEVRSLPLLRLAANHTPASAPPKCAMCPPALLEVMNSKSVPITMSARYFSRMVPPYRIVGLAIGGGGYNGKYRGRSTQHERIVCHGTEIRENIIRNHIKQSAADSSYYIKASQVLAREEIQKQRPEPIEP